MIRNSAHATINALRILGPFGVLLLVADDGYETWHAFDHGHGAPFHPLLLVSDAVAVGALWRRGSDPHRAALVAAVTSLAVTAVVVPLVAVTGRYLWAAGFAEAVSLLALLVAVVRRTRRRTEPSAVALGTALALLIVLRDAGVYAIKDWRHGAVPLTSAIVLAAVLLLLAVLLGGYLRMMDTERAAAEAIVRQSERLTLAYELHDLVAHHLTGIVLRAQSAQLGDTGPAGAIGALADIEQVGTEALGSIRRMARHLRGVPAAAPGPTSLTDVTDLIAGAGFGSGQAWVSLDISAELRTTPPPPEVVTSVYRVVREALTNVRRHAGDARRVEIRIDRGVGEVRVAVRDDGQGRAPKFTAGTGTGLIGLAERLTALGGSLTTGPGPGGGWQLRAAVPEPVAVPGPRDRS